MYDNGLLKYYKTCPHKDGFLDASKIDLKRKDFVVLKTSQCTVSGKSYYLKVHTATGTISKPHADAEILLSQIYTKLGLPSAIYLPVQSDGDKFLLCNDVEKPNVVLATNYLAQKIHAGYPRLVPFLARDYVGKSPEKYFTKHAMAQQTKLRILDTATYNTDRHLANFFYTLEHPSPCHEGVDSTQQPHSAGEQIVDFFRSIRPNKAKDIVAIDFESSGGNVSIVSATNTICSELNSYMNDFKRGTMPREEMLEEFATNPNLNDVIDKKEFAEELGSLDVEGVAQDIEDTIDYKVDKSFVDVISRSCEQVAECLIK